MIHPRFSRDSLPYLFIAGIALFMFRGIFAPGFMSGYDNSLHYYDAYYLINTLLPQYHWINGWSMQGMCGLPIFVDYYQVSTWLVLFLDKICFLSLNLSYKVTVLFSYIVLGAGFYKISSYRFGKIASLLIAVCLMLQKDIYLDRILGGLWTNYLALGLLFIFVHLLDIYIESMTLKKAAILGLLLALLILTHVFVAIFAFLLFSIYAVPYFLNAFKKKNVFKQSLIFVIPLMAFMISSYYLYGFIIARNYFSTYSSKEILTGIAWASKSFFGPLEKGTDLLSTFMINVPVLTRIVFSVFGLYIYFRKEKNSNIKRFLTCVAIFIFISLVFFSDILVNIFSWWRSVPFIGNLQTNRFLIYPQIGMYLFAAYGLFKFLGYSRKKKLVATLCAILILFSVFFHYACFAREGSRTLEQSPQMVNIFKVWNWVNENIAPDKERITYQDTYGNIDDPILLRSDVFNLSGIFTKVAQIGVSRPASPFPQEKYMRNDHNRIFGVSLDTVDDTFIGEMMGYFNSRYIVSVEPKLRQKLSNSKLFSKEENFGVFHIFKSRGIPDGWISFERSAAYKTVKFENQDLEFDIWNKSPRNEVLIKVSYHPFWRAWLNEKPVKINRDKYSLMKVALPETGYFRLKMSFNSFNHLWVSISCLSLIIGAVIATRRRS